MNTILVPLDYARFSECNDILVASAPANSHTNFKSMGEVGCRFDYLQARWLQVPHIVGCGRVRGIQWYQNHIHWTKYTEVMNANSAAY